MGELPIATQARLLRVLETGEYIRVGGQKVMKTDVRIVAATNVNMHKAITEGRFREDLYYRLNTIPVQMPPLRDRGEDILLLFRLFTMQMAEKYRIPRITLTDDAKALMLKYKWPGNVRQLKNITEQMSVLSQQREINAEMLSKFIPNGQESTELTTTATPGAHSYESEREILYKILYELRGNVSELRHEVTSLRKQIDDNRAIDSFAASRQLASLSAPDTHIGTDAAHAIQPYPHAARPYNNGAQAYNNGANPHFDPYQEAEAEEINDAESISMGEGESLNLSDIGRQAVEMALERNNGNRKKAAQELGISDRTLYRRIKQYGLEK